MARSPVSYNSASSQFFIVQSDSTYLDGDYAAFGRVTDGMDIVDAICKDTRCRTTTERYCPKTSP
jgi:peptidyl-prolyl cis-trans isomerase B (cyclophilin B)